MSGLRQTTMNLICNTIFDLDFRYFLIRILPETFAVCPAYYAKIEISWLTRISAMVNKCNLQLASRCYMDVTYTPCVARNMISFSVKLIHAIRSIHQYLCIYELKLCSLRNEKGCSIYTVTTPKLVRNELSER